MYTLYIANKNYSSWSLRPWVLMKTLSIPFTEKLVPFSAGSCWDEFREFSPNGRVPCLHHDGRVVWDSLAITEYLAEHHDGVWPLNVEARAWARSATSEMHAGFSALRDECSMNCGLRVQLHSISPELQHDLDRLDELWTEGLQRFGGPFLTGDAFCAVDAFFAPVAFRLQTFNLLMSDVATNYAQHLLEMDAMRNWYEAALHEHWVDPAHEQEISETGLILKDLRTSH